MAKDYSLAMGGLEVVSAPSWLGVGCEQLRYPVGHPQRQWYDESVAAKARGENVYVEPFEPKFTIPARTKTGVPNYRDVVGRFLVQERGASGRFYTDGYAIYSYGSHWKMAYWQDGKIYWTDHMFEKPYSSYTSGHMSAVRNDPRLFGRIENINVFPEALKEQVAGAIRNAALRLVSVDDMRAAIWNVAPCSDEILRECFERAQILMHLHFVSERKRVIKSYTGWRKWYTKESIAAVRAFFGTVTESHYRQLLTEYETRIFKEYGVKMSPIPTRKMPKCPDLVGKPYDIRTVAKKRKNGTLAWHFVGDDRRLRFGDGREVTVGSIFENKIEQRGERIVLCHYGLHGSVRMLDARSYFSGRWLTRTLHYGVIDDGGDKIASQFRECLGMIDLDSQAARGVMAAIRHGENETAERMALSLLDMTATQRAVSTVGVVEDRDEEVG